MSKNNGKSNKPLNVKYINSNIKSVFEKKNIGLLTKATYNHIHLHMGFIAHYNLEGFKCTYENLEQFAHKLLTSEMHNDLHQTLRQHAKYYINDGYFADQYGQDVAQSWHDATVSIRKQAINYLRNNSKDEILKFNIELLEDNQLHG